MIVDVPHRESASGQTRAIRLRGWNTARDADKHIRPARPQARQDEPEGPVCHTDAGPARRVPKVGQLRAKGEVFERQLRSGAEGGVQRSKEAHEQGGHGWIMHEGR
jgi:hypothetical protein